MIYKLHEETLILVKEERRLTGLVIENLQKISDSQLFLEMGYSSLFEYCTKALGYSEACAYRRIQAVKVARILPEIKEKLDSGVLNLTNVAMAQRLISSATLTLDKKREVLKSIENCSKKQTERVIAEISAEMGIFDPPKAKDKVRYVSGDEADLSIRLDRETLEMLDKLKSLRSHTNPNMSYADLVKYMCKVMIKKIEPKTPSAKAAVQKSSSPNPRYISADLKRKIWQRDRGICSYSDPKTGRHCESRHLLQMDHIKPVFLGGKASLENLRLLCYAHHRYREKEFDRRP